MNANKQSADPAQWVTRYGDYLLSVAMLKLNDMQLSEDLVQETFLSAIKGIDAYKGDSSEKTWLTAILKNKIFDFYRKKALFLNADQYLESSEDTFTGHFFESGPDHIPHWLDETYPRNWAVAADTKLNDQEFESVLQACIKKMPAKLVAVFQAKYLEENTAEQICKELDISASNYWVIIHRAKVLMRSCLEKNWFLR